ncbi:protein MHF2 [Sesamum angolense]|uniref:Protein MHF2 n=1 Tax=Sesamum angolense TaxID=2727404 RepID=A0AAE1WZS8_9LAMI|nr:protein MHF2 [Sesamum angolense]
MEENTFDPELIRAIFRLVWERRAAEREKNQLSETEAEAGPSTSKRSRLTSINGNALKLSCELLRVCDSLFFFMNDRGYSQGSRIRKGSSEQTKVLSFGFTVLNSCTGDFHDSFAIGMFECG